MRSALMYACSFAATAVGCFVWIGSNVSFVLRVLLAVCAASVVFIWGAFQVWVATTIASAVPKWKRRERQADAEDAMSENGE